MLTNLHSNLRKMAATSSSSSLSRAVTSLLKQPVVTSTLSQRALHVKLTELSKTGLFPASSLTSSASPLHNAAFQGNLSRTLRSFSTEAPKDASGAQSADAEAAPAAEGAPEVPEAEVKLAAEIEELKAKNADLLDRYRRSIAESDNMRKRLTKQIDDAKIFGIQGFCKDLLEVADVLNMAIAGVGEDVLAKESSYLRDMHQGLKLTESQMHQVFRRHGLEQDNPLNEKFDPNKHEALFQIPNGDVDPNTVLDVQKVGYLLHGRTIRPAKVGVSRKP